MTQSFTLPPPPDEALVRQWEEECARLDTMIATMSVARDNYAQLVRSAKGLARDSEPLTVKGSDSHREAEVKTEPMPSRKAVAKPAPKAGRRKKRSKRRGAETWVSAIEAIVKGNPQGVTYERIKELVPEKLKEQMKEFPELKGFYAALRSLEKAKVIVRHNSMAFTKQGFAAYQARLPAGKVAPPSRRRGSPIEDAIKEFLRDNGASKASTIRAHLIQFPGFGASVLKYSSAMYNVLLRLKKNGDILHDEETAMFSLAQENGAPAEASAPDAGRAATLPFENVIGFRQPR